MKVLNNEKNAVFNSCKALLLLSHEKEHILNNYERWRIPLVVMKVLHDKVLNTIDKKIFQRIQLNLQPDENVFTMKFVMKRALPSGNTNGSSNTSTSNTSTSKVNHKPIIPKLPLDTLYDTTSYDTTTTNTTTPYNTTTTSTTPYETYTQREHYARQAASILYGHINKIPIKKPKKITPYRRKIFKSPKNIHRISPKSSCSLCTHVTATTGTINTIYTGEYDKDGVREGYSEDDCDCIQGLVDRVIKKNKLPHNTTTTGTIVSSLTTIDSMKNLFRSSYNTLTFSNKYKTNLTTTAIAEHDEYGAVSTTTAKPRSTINIYTNNGSNILTTTIANVANAITTAKSHYYKREYDDCDYNEPIIEENIVKNKENRYSIFGGLAHMFKYSNKVLPVE